MSERRACVPVLFRITPVSTVQYLLNGGFVVNF